MSLKLNLPQDRFYHMDKPFRAYVAGYRGGKTFLGCVRLCALALQYPGIRLGYFAPTYPQIVDIFFDTIVEVCELMGMKCEIIASKFIAKLYYCGDLHAVVKCRSMEHPERIVGFNINHALVDEIDTMKLAKADKAWKKIIARLSSGGFDEQRLYDASIDADLIIEALGENTVDFTTTPEGFNWIYHYFVEEVEANPELQKYYGYVQASTRDNEKNLPEGYIDSLLATYPANLVEAYVDGRFANLSSGTVYHAFDRSANKSIETIQPNDTLHIGMDFNVERMCAIIHVVRDGQPHAVEEIINEYDTPAMISVIESRYAGHSIVVYPDSSGKNRKSNEASKTDISQLEAAGFTLRYKGRNPGIKDRVSAMNAMFCNGKGERRYFVSTDQCPHYTKKLEQQVYKNGEPEKDGTEDANDAGGYYIAYEYPVKRPTANVPLIRITA